MASSTENQIQIQAIQTELQNTITFSGMNDTQKKDVISQLFPNGVAFNYLDPKANIGDFVFGSDEPTINTGGFFFAKVVTSPSGALTEANLEFLFRS